MGQSRPRVSPTIMFCLLIIVPLITLCCAANNNSSGKTNKLAHCASGACFCAPGIPGIPGSPGPAGPAGSSCSSGSQGSRGPRGVKGDTGAKGSQGPPGPKGPPGTLGTQGSTGPAGPRGTKGDAGAKGRQGPPGPQGPSGTSGSNWKQCVFNNLSEGKDTGLIKECIFKKKSAKTGLRVFWNGDLRLYNCHSCCRRWYFTFNGAECSAPAAIDGVIYMVHGHGYKKNLHRPRQIEGVCEKVHKGTVRVGFWVGNCAGYGSADAHTGWNSVSRIHVEEVPPPQA